MGVRQRTDQRNRITKIRSTEDEQNPVGVAVTTLYDRAGNLQFDGTYFYQYDAWNRLVQVNRCSWAVGNGPPPGAPPGGGGWGGGPQGEGESALEGNAGTWGLLHFGPLVKHHYYDGLGRLVKTQSPFPEPDSLEHPGLVRSERFYYDGIRRIQELVTDPVLNQSAAGQSGDPELENLAGQGEGDPEGAPGPLEEGQLEGEGDPPPLEGGQIGWTPNAYLAREYIWGPGDGHAGVDELLVQFDQGRVPWWVIQDGGGDVVAIVETPGTGPSSTDPSRVAGQWTFDAYGAVQSFDLLHDHPPVHCGHKGLFFDRLDVGVVEVGTGGAITENDRLAPGAELSGYARNRHYSPRHGRWLQMDPNATGSSLIADTAMHGKALLAVVSAFDVDRSYSDGENLFQALRSSPWQLSDPRGLFVGTGVDVYLTIGLEAGTLAYELVSEYADNMDYDLDWAMDWSLSDDWHSRTDASWITDVYASHDLNGAINDFANPLSFLDGLFATNPIGSLGAQGVDNDFANVSPAFRAAARAANKVGRVGHHAISWYKHMVRWYKEFQTTWPVKCNLQSLRNFVDLPAAAHGKGRHRDSYHKKVKAHFADGMVKKLGNDPRRVSRANMQRAFDELLDELRVAIKHNPDHWFK